ncbi:MAG: hypothetical protein AAFZ65_09350 [Planctomycetota bacterium]
MKSLLTVSALAALLGPPQETAPVESTPSPFGNPIDSPAEGASVTAEGLRKNIRDMRMNLLLGGDRVKAAEQEAIGFYRERQGFVDQRLDSVDADLIELRASYEVVLDRSLNATNSGQRTAAFREAQPLRQEIEALEAERGELVGKRDHLQGLVRGIESRDDDRQRLVAQLETSAVTPETLALPAFGVGLAPPPAPTEAGSPLEDVGLLADLLERDPDRARTLMWDLDPVGYWEIFPLDPPTRPLVQAMPFPPLDLPAGY